MRAAQAYWDGKDELFKKLVEKQTPKELAFAASSVLQKARVSTPALREGGGFSSKEIAEGKPIFNHVEMWSTSKMIELVSVEAAKLASDAIENLESVLKDFRSKIGNDLSSIKAASARVQDEVLRMNAKYTEAVKVLSSPEFERAVQNAERMAMALESLGKVSSSKLNIDIGV